MNAKNTYVKDIQAGNRVSDLFLVIEKNMSLSQKGNPYLSLRLRDKTGEIEGRVWNNAVELNKRFQKGDIVLIHGRALNYKDNIQLSITDIEGVTETGINPVDYSPAAKNDIDEMFAALMEYAGKIQSPPLKDLLVLIFDDEDIRHAFKYAPAAKGFHHSYIGGLLEHTLSVARLLDRIADHYPKINRDLLITGGILHDIGKIYELSFKRLIDYTSEGRLIGHIVLAVELVDAKIAQIKQFPANLSLELRHILLSHHGVLEYGSPKRPKTLEALMVNFIDDMDAKINAFTDCIDNSDGDSDWTPFHRLLERFIYKGGN